MIVACKLTSASTALFKLKSSLVIYIVKIRASNFKLAPRASHSSSLHQPWETSATAREANGPVCCHEGVVLCIFSGTFTQARGITAGAGRRRAAPAELGVLSARC